jgi:hypothetical protein
MLWEEEVGSDGTPGMAGYLEPTHHIGKYIIRYQKNRFKYDRKVHMEAGVDGLKLERVRC